MLNANETIFSMSFLMPIIIFGVFMIVIIALIIDAIVKSIKRKKTIKNGIKKVARFKSIYMGRFNTVTSGNRVVSATQYYGVIYEVRNSEGKLITIKSPDSYVLEQVKVFENIRFFDVYVLGDFATIPYVPNKSQIEKYNVLKNIKKCSYCGSSVDIKESKCPQCGSSVFDEMI